MKSTVMRTHMRTFFCFNELKKEFVAEENSDKTSNILQKSLGKKKLIFTCSGVGSGNSQF